MKALTYNDLIQAQKEISAHNQQLREQSEQLEQDNRALRSQSLQLVGAAAQGQGRRGNQRGPAWVGVSPLQTGGSGRLASVSGFVWRRVAPPVKACRACPIRQAPALGWMVSQRPWVSGSHTVSGSRCGVMGAPPCRRVGAGAALSVRGGS